MEKVVARKADRSFGRSKAANGLFSTRWKRTWRIGYKTHTGWEAHLTLLPTTACLDLHRPQLCRVPLGVAMAMALGSKIWMAATLGGNWMLSLGSTITKMQLVRFGHGATGRRCSSSPTFLKINNANWLTPMLPMKESCVPLLTQGTWCTNANPTEGFTQTRVRARTRPRANRDQLRKVAKRVRQWQPMLLLWVPQGTLGASSAALRIMSSDPVQRGRSLAPSPRARALAMSMWRRRWGISTASTSTLVFLPRRHEEHLL